MKARAIAALILAPALAACLGPAAHIEPASGAADVFSATPVFGDPLAYDTSGPFSRILEPGTLPLLPDEHLVLPSPVDGVGLRMGIVRPDTREPVPVIAAVGPYFRNLDGSIPLAENRGTQSAAFLIENFVPRGYAVALVATRGSAGSGGCAEFFGPAEAADLDAAVTYLGTQPWSSGAVGLIGHSAEGATIFAAASTGNPHLRTIVPIAGWPDFGTFAFRNGTTSTSGATLPQLGTWFWGGMRDAEGAPCLGGVRGGEAVAAFQLTGSDPTGYFAERDHRPAILASYRGSVLLVQGLRDMVVEPRNQHPWILELEAEGVVVKQLLGQWPHGRWPDGTAPSEGPVRLPFGGFGTPTPRHDWAEILLHWFERWLKGDVGIDLGPPVQVADSAGAWRSELSWPPADARSFPLFLGADDGLHPEGAPGEGLRPLAADPVTLLAAGRSARPGDALPCPGCATFATEPLGETLRFGGSPLLHARVTPTAPSGHLTAILLVRHEGTDLPVGWAQIDLRYAEGGATPAPIVPGRPLVARMQFEPLDVVVPAGASLVLVVTQGGFGSPTAPVGVVLHQTGSTPPAPVLLHVGGEASGLILPRIERPEDDGSFFRPPGT